MTLMFVVTDGSSDQHPHGAAPTITCVLYMYMQNNMVKYSDNFFGYTLLIVATYDRFY